MDGKSAIAAIASFALVLAGPAVQAEGVGDPPAATAASDDASGFLAGWATIVARARSTQPSWSSPLATTTGLLEQRLRFDIEEQHAGSGTRTTVIDGGRGVDFIVSDATEIQIAAPPYDIREDRSARSVATGFADWPFLRVEHRLAGAPAEDGDYVLTAWVGVQAPSGIEKLTSSAWIWTPTLAFGKGWGDFDIQATFGAALPASQVQSIGDQLQTNLAFQYHVQPVFWPQVEVNWTYYPNGRREGLNQVFLTPGLVVGRFNLGAVAGTIGAGYQFAVAPSYRPSPLTPSYQHAWLFTTRLNF